MMHVRLRDQVLLGDIAAGKMRELAEIIGVPRLFDAVWFLGGSSFFIPRRMAAMAEDARELAELIGPQRMFEVALSFGGSTLHIPSREIDLAPGFFSRFVQENITDYTPCQLSWMLDVSDTVMFGILRSLNISPRNYLANASEQEQDFSSY